MDRVQYNKLFQTLQNIDIRLLFSRYWNQSATVTLDGEETSQIPIKRRVRQGCILSPTLLNLYTENIFKKATQSDEGVRIGGETISNIRYADDTVLLAESLKEIHCILDKINRESNRWRLKINVKKN